MSSRPQPIFWQVATYSKALAVVLVNSNLGKGTAIVVKLLTAGQ